jgi:hypothetical protein
METGGRPLARGSVKWRSLYAAPVGAKPSADALGRASVRPLTSSCAVGSSVAPFMSSSSTRFKRCRQHPPMKKTTRAAGRSVRRIDATDATAATSSATPINRYDAERSRIPNLVVREQRRPLAEWSRVGRYGDAVRASRAARDEQNVRYVSSDRTGDWGLRVAKVLGR